MPTAGFVAWRRMQASLPVSVEIEAGPTVVVRGIEDYHG